MDLLCHTYGCFYQWWIDWEVFFAGVLAVAGAAVTVWQIRQQMGESEEAFERKQRATRALVSFALSAITDYCERSVRWLEKAREPAKETERIAGPNRVQVDAVPEMDEERLLILRDCVETAEADVSDKILELFAKLQVQQARIADLHDNLSTFGTKKRVVVGIGHEIDGYIVDTIELRALSDNLFGFARAGLDLRAPIDPQAIYNAFSLLDLDEFNHAAVYQKMNERHPPKNAKADQVELTSAPPPP
jgi:hypothetical protein